MTHFSLPKEVSRLLRTAKRRISGSMTNASDMTPCETPRLLGRHGHAQAFREASTKTKRYDEEVCLDSQSLPLSSFAAKVHSNKMPQPEAVEEASHDGSYKQCPGSKQVQFSTVIEVISSCDKGSPIADKLDELPFASTSSAEEKRISKGGTEAPLIMGPAVGQEISSVRAGRWRSRGRSQAPRDEDITRIPVANSPRDISPISIPRRSGGNDELRMMKSTFSLFVESDDEVRLLSASRANARLQSDGEIPSTITSLQSGVESFNPNSKAIARAAIDDLRSLSPVALPQRREKANSGGSDNEDKRAAQNSTLLEGSHREISTASDTRTEIAFTRQSEIASRQRSLFEVTKSKPQHRATDDVSHWPCSHKSSNYSVEDAQTPLQIAVEAKRKLLLTYEKHLDNLQASLPDMASPRVDAAQFQKMESCYNELVHFWNSRNPEERVFLHGSHLHNWPVERRESLKILCASAGLGACKSSKNAEISKASVAEGDRLLTPGHNITDALSDTLTLRPNITDALSDTLTSRPNIFDLDTCQVANWSKLCQTL